MTDDEANFLAKLEKAIVEKYGRSALYDPNSRWTPEKEKKYLEEIKEISKEKEQLEENVERYEISDIIIEKNLFIDEKIDRVCPVCSKFSFDSKDDIYMKRYECCQACYYDFVDGREERWSTGWRPSKEK